MEAVDYFMVVILMASAYLLGVLTVIACWLFALDKRLREKHSWKDET